MRRDRLTFAIDAGYSDDSACPVSVTPSIPIRSICRPPFIRRQQPLLAHHCLGIAHSSYFDITREPKTEAEIQKLLAQGTVQFAVEIPVDFSRKLLRGEQPDLLLEADATDPMAIGYAVAAMNSLMRLF